MLCHSTGNPAAQIEESEQRGANGGLADDEDEAEGGGDAYMERLARIRERIKVRRAAPWLRNAGLSWPQLAMQ